MSRSNGLEVVVPQNYDIRKVPAFVESKRAWVERVQRRFATSVPQQRIDLRPGQICLPGISREWNVRYEPSKRRSVAVVEQGNALLLSGNIGSDAALKRAWQKWLIKIGRAELIPWLAKVSDEIELPFCKAQVRLQRSRWGSCSRAKTISVNAKLLFLPAEVIRYLFIHELCHTVQMNHSARFWSLVRKKEPSFAKLDKQLRGAMNGLPGWL